MTVSEIAVGNALSTPEVSGISNILLRGNRVEGFIPLSSKLLIARVGVLYEKWLIDKDFPFCTASVSRKGCGTIMRLV